MKSPYFKRYEFACRCGCGFDAVDVDLLRILDDVRVNFGAPVAINSACRCESHNAEIGGKKGSMHVKAKAADIVVKNIAPDDVHAYLCDKYPHTFGIGQYDTFTHVDVRDAKARWDLRR